MSDSLFFVVENHRDALILSRLIAPQLSPDKPRIYATHGTTILAALARNILFHHGGRVMMVENSQTYCTRRAEEFRDLSLHLMSQVAGRTEFDLFSFLPEMASVFYEVPEILENVDVPALRRPKDDRLHAQPYKELQDFLGGTPLEVWIKSLSEEAWAKLREGPQARALTARIEALRSGQVPEDG
jgi:hypothetical protein